MPDPNLSSCPTTGLSRITIDDHSTAPRNVIRPGEAQNVEQQTQRAPKRTHQRRRSLSVASDQPSVETVVVKAKRAASNLWTLLHAQNCVLAKCPHAGCQEARRLHLHIKTCSAGSCDFACPENFSGCEQARKLLAHYKKCRAQRARQATLMSRQQQSCLVCSLVARQARSTLERSAFAKKTASSVNSRSNKASPSYLVMKDLVVPSSAEKMPPPPPRSSKVRFRAEHDEILVSSSFEDGNITLQHSLRPHTFSMSEPVPESKHDDDEGF